MAGKERSTEAAELALAKIRELVEDIEVAMLNTVGSEGLVRSRPMGTVWDREQSALWLFVDVNSAAHEEIVQHPKVGLSYSDPERDRYVSISGDASFSDDQEQVRRHWRPEFEKWFPGGPDDPSLGLLRVRITQAEYWDDSAKLMRNFFDTLGAPYAGIPDDAVGEHVRVKSRQ